MMRIRILLVFVLVLLGACSDPPVQTTARPGYLLVESDVRNTLTIFDSDSFTITRQIKLPQSWPESFSRDPEGRVWIGFASDFQRNDNRVHVYSPQGDLIHELRLCERPEGGIVFAGDYAFVVCANKGFSATVAVVDRSTLTVKTSIPITLEGDFLAIASAANSDTVVVTGLTSGPEEGSYAAVALINVSTLQAKPPLRLGYSSDIHQILPFNERFYLLNVGSWLMPRGEARDVFILTPGDPPTIESMSVAPSPLWGAILNDHLYTYHDPTYNQTNDDPSRMIARTNLTTGEVETWSLPDNWDAGDLALIDGQIILSFWGLPPDGADGGLYRFDPTTSQLTLLIPSRGVSRIIPPIVSSP